MTKVAISGIYPRDLRSGIVDAAEVEPTNQDWNIRVHWTCVSG